MYAPLARPDYYETSAPPGGHQPATDLPAAGPAARWEGRPQVVPTFTTEPIKELGARLYPGSLAMPTPQAFSMASPPDLKTGFGVDRPRHRAGAVTRCEPGPYPSGLSRVGHLRGVRQRFLSYAFSSLLAGPGPSDSADPLRTLVRAASRRRVRSRATTALSFTGQLRLPGGGVLSPPLGSSSASWRA